MVCGDAGEVAFFPQRLVGVRGDTEVGHELFSWKKYGRGLSRTRLVGRGGGAPGKPVKVGDLVDLRNAVGDRDAVTFHALQPDIERVDVEVVAQG